MELLSVLEKFFSEAEEKNLSYERLKWELDNYVYPFIGSKIAEGSLSKEEGIKLITFCEKRLREFRKDRE
jgi:hypothetical protein